ncbi:MAG: TonB-dependent receptor [Bacteroidales bacterium]|nr:TonB-dependent receptor [Bacteroidales bacterium]
MKKIISTLFFIGLFFIGFSQTISVKDAETGRPLQLVSLVSESPKTSVTTNQQGNAEFSGFKGAEVIEIRLLGYQSMILSYAAIEQNGFIVKLSQTQLSLDEIVISATRWEQNKRDIPNKITSISVKQVALQNPQTAADLLGTSGEVFIQKSQQGGGSPMIRGFATNRLLYTIDGVRMNTAIFRSGNIQNVISLDPFAIENTEVFFGPGSIIYGSDAIGGVMSFRTLTPQFSQNEEHLVTGKAVMRYSSANNEKTGHFDISAGWKKWAFTSSVTSYDYSNLLMGSKNGPDEYLKPYYVQRIDSVDHVFTNENQEIQNPTAYTQINFMQKVRFQPNKHWDIQYGFHYSETSNYSRYDRLIETSPSGLPVYAVWDYGPQKWMMNFLGITHESDNLFYNQMNLRIAFQNFGESRIDRRLNNTRLRTQTEEVEALSMNVDFVKLSGDHKLFYGFEYVINDVVSDGKAQNIKTGAPIRVPDRYPASTWQSAGVYLNYQYRFSEKTLLQAGMRYSHFAIESDFSDLLEFYPLPYNKVELNNDAVTGSVGVVFKPSAEWTLSADASTGFRAPNVDDIGKMFDFQAGDVIVPNPELKAEYAYNGEINIARIFNDKVKIDITGFYTLLDDAMVRREYTLNGQDSILYNGEMSKVYAIQNAAKANVYGINAGLEFKLGQGFGISGRFNYQHGEEEMDDGMISPSRHAAPWFGVARLTYIKNRINMQLYTMFSNEVNYENLNPEEQQKDVIYAEDENGNPYSPSWHTLNFKAMYQVTDYLSASAGLENITDQRYRPYSSGLVAPGRNFIISLILNF